MKTKILSLLVITCLMITTFASGISIKKDKKKISENDDKNIFNNLLKDESGFKDNIFDFKIKTLMRIGRLPSISYCIIKNKSVVSSNAYGFSNRLSRVHATENTQYAIGSITKSITAVAAMQLYEKGYFDLDKDINEYIPFKLRNPHFPDTNITVRMLLSHQSSLSLENLRFDLSLIGVNESEFPYPWIKNYLVPGGEIYNPRAWQKNEPGSKCQYSNAGYVIIQLMIEEITDQKIEDYCQKNIFDPLNMENTSFKINKFEESKVARPYMRLLGFYIPLPYYNNPLEGPAGIRTSVCDLSRFLLVHLGGGYYDGVRILNESTIDLMHTVQYPNSSFFGMRCGIGWFYRERNNAVYGGHEGGSLGGSARMMIRTTDNTSVILFSNISLSRPLSLYAERKIFSILFEKADSL